jgi:hypothetical protein
MIYRKTTSFHVARPIKHVAQGQSTDLPEPSKIMIYRKTTPFHVARPIKHVAQGGLEDEQVERVCYVNWDSPSICIVYFNYDYD